MSEKAAAMRVDGGAQKTLVPVLSVRPDLFLPGFSLILATFCPSGRFLYGSFCRFMHGDLILGHSFWARFVSTLFSTLKDVTKLVTISQQRNDRAVFENR